MIRRAFRLALATVIAATAIIVAPGTPTVHASTAAPYIRTVEPWVPGLVPQTPPKVNLTAACVRFARGGQLEAVFGYDNPGPQAVLTRIEDDPPVGGTEVQRNVVLRTRYQLRQRGQQTTVEQFGPQATLFRPGNHPYAFAVRFNINEAVAWRVQIPSSDQFGPTWKVTVRPKLLAPCRRDVPAHFAVVQTAQATQSPNNVVGLVDNTITSYDGTFSIGVDNVRTVCSAGGVVQPLEFLAGWSAPATNLRPLGRAEIVETVPFNSALNAGFELTTTKTRAVVDTSQEVTWTGPIADVYGYCAFSDGQIVKSDVFWAESVVFSRLTPVVVDGVIVRYSITSVAPGGVRIR